MGDLKQLCFSTSLVNVFYFNLNAQIACVCLSVCVCGFFLIPETESLVVHERYGANHLIVKSYRYSNGKHSVLH